MCYDLHTWIGRRQLSVQSNVYCIYKGPLFSWEWNSVYNHVMVIFHTLYILCFYVLVIHNEKAYKITKRKRKEKQSVKMYVEIKFDSSWSDRQGSTGCEISQEYPLLPTREGFTQVYTLS